MNQFRKLKYKGKDIPIIKPGIESESKKVSPAKNAKKEVKSNDQQGSKDTGKNL